MIRRVPLIFLAGVVEGESPAVWPVFVVGDEPIDLCFKVAIDEHRAAAENRYELFRRAG